MKGPTDIIVKSPQKLDKSHIRAGSRPLSAKEIKDTRLRTLKERQNEERERKLEEIKAQALNAQKFKEQMELERKQRLEELKHKEEMRRQQAEERRKAIVDAERDRLESILKRNQEREARVESKRRNESSSRVFAFGSSSPRMLEPTDSIASFWGHRRATSTQNIPETQLTSKQSERDLTGNSKKRATSVNSLERSTENLHMSTSMYEIFRWEGCEPKETLTPNSAQTITRSTSSHFGTGAPSAQPQVPAGCASGYVGRRRTDLMPTIPIRDSSSLTRKPFTRSPGRAYSMSRLDQLSKPRKRLPAVSETSSISPARPLSCPQPSSVSRSMSHLAVGVKSTYQPQQQLPLRKSDSRSMQQLSSVPLPRPTRATQLRQQKLMAAGAGASSSEASSRPSSSLSQQSTCSVASSVVMRHRPSSASRHQRPISIAVTGVTQDSKKLDPKPPLPKTKPTSHSNSVASRKKTKPKTEEKVPEKPLETAVKVEPEEPQVHQPPQEAEVKPEVKAEVKTEIPSEEPKVEVAAEPSVPEPPDRGASPPDAVKQELPEDPEQMSGSMTASMSAKIRITTEEEAKAALAERRRIAREEAERQAEMERKRIEEEARLELERQQREEEQQRLLIEQQRAAEQERLEEAIKEAQKREEQERLRREEEQKAKLLKEEAERKAREEADRQKAELQERLKNEEKEREARRKRVEAIMLRTRAKNSSNGNSNTNLQNDEKNDENVKSEKINGAKQGASENGHRNGKDAPIVDNIIPVDDDTLNSNNTWQPDLFM